jgi:hypothetical protein
MNVIDYITITCNLENVRLHITFDYMKNVIDYMKNVIDYKLRLPHVWLNITTFYWSAFTKCEWSCIIALGVLTVSLSKICLLDFRTVSTVCFSFSFDHIYNCTERARLSCKILFLIWFVYLANYYKLMKEIKTRQYNH